jgi:transposase
MRRITVGVDAGERTHQVAASEPAADATLGQGSFSVSRAGFERLAAFLQQHAPDQADVLVGIEATGHYHVTLLEFLLERGYGVVLVNPYQAAQFRRSQGAKAKTDRIDARALARFIAVSGLRPLSVTDARLAGVRELTRFPGRSGRPAHDGPQHLAGGARPGLPGAADGLQAARQAHRPGRVESRGVCKSGGGR